MSERLAFDVYYWADEDGVVHRINKVVPTTTPRVHSPFFKRPYVDTTEGEARTLCGLRLGHYLYYYTLDPPSCMCCITGTFLGFRTIDVQGPPK
jgi:hypothetical protein